MFLIPEMLLCYATAIIVHSNTEEYATSPPLYFPFSKRNTFIFSQGRMTERCGVVLKENPLISIHTSGSFKKKYFSLRPPTEGDVQGVRVSFF